MAFSDEEGFCKVATVDAIAEESYSLSIPRYVKRTVENGDNSDNRSLEETWADWEQSGRMFWQEMDDLLEMLSGLLVEDTPRE